MKVKNISIESESVFELNGKLPLKRVVQLVLQHVFAMFADNITIL